MRTSMDAAFLYLETPIWQMHAGEVMILDPSTARNGFDVELYKKAIDERIRSNDALRSRVVIPPLGLGRPARAELADFDLDDYVHALTVPPPGGPRELAAVVGQLVPPLLDRRKALWRAWVVDGLADDRVALVHKGHHALSDGMTGMRTLASLFDTEPDAPPAAYVEPERVPPPTLLGFAADAVATTVRAPRSLVRLMRRAPAVVGDVVRLLRVPERDLALPLTAPQIGVNGRLTARRAVAWVSLPLGDVELVKNALHVKVNDILLAVTGGAFRRYLASRGGVPERPLIAGVPVSLHEMRADGLVAEEGNQVSAMFVSLGTNVADPVERVRAVRRSSLAAKRLQTTIGPHGSSDLLELIPPLLMRGVAEAYTRLQLSRLHRPSITTLFTNMPGPSFPLYTAGARVDAMHILPPILVDNGIGVAAVSYCGSVDIGLTACPDIVADPWALADEYPAAIAELVDAVGGH